MKPQSNTTVIDPNCSLDKSTKPATATATTASSSSSSGLLEMKMNLAKLTKRSPVTPSLNGSDCDDTVTSSSTSTRTDRSSFLRGSHPARLTAASTNNNNNNKKKNSLSIVHANNIFLREFRKSFEEQFAKHDDDYDLYHRHRDNEDCEDEDGEDLIAELMEDSAHLNVVVMKPTASPRRYKSSGPRLETATTSSSAETTTTTQPSSRHGVRFAEQTEVREYPIIIGVNPSVWRGAPLTMDWKWISTELVPLRTNDEEEAADAAPASTDDDQQALLVTYNDDDDNGEAAGPHRRTALERERLLLALGYSRKEIRNGAKAVAPTRRRRAVTRQESTMASKAMERMEVIRGNLKNAWTLGKHKRLEREYFQQCGLL